MQFGAGDLGFAVFVGHLIVDERAFWRKHLLYIFARYLELPILNLAYQTMHGPLRFVSVNPISRFILKKLAVHPFAAYIDTCHPMPTADVLALIERQEVDLAVGPCRCRLAHGRCSHPMETDLVLRNGVGAFTKAWPADYRRLSKEEAADLVQKCADQGLWHMVFVHCPVGSALNEYVICNCCTDGCVPFMLNKIYGQDGFPILRGEYVARTINENCQGCGECLEVCPWEARALVDGRTSVDAEKCFGCGLCARKCRNDAVDLQKIRPRPPLRSYLGNSE